MDEDLASVSKMSEGFGYEKRLEPLHMKNQFQKLGLDLEYPFMF